MKFLQSSTASSLFSSSFQPFVVLCLFVVTPAATAQEDAKPEAKSASLGQSSAINLQYGNINIGTISSWHRADGMANRNPKGWDGGTYPSGMVNAIFQDGIIWGGKLFTDGALTKRPPSQNIRVGGTATFSLNTNAGAVTGFGATAERLPETGFRVWRIRRDFPNLTPSMLRTDAAGVFDTSEEGVSTAEIAEVLARYKMDWAEWPVHYGAPFVDRNNNGIFDPVSGWEQMSGEQLKDEGSDEPGMAAGNNESPADQVVWMVFNDLDPIKSKTNYGSLPLGLEVQKTVWAYKRTDGIGSTYFTMYRLINKGGVVVDTPNVKGAFWIDSMYVAQWSDVDLGNSGNDVGGCDVPRNLGFIYNGANFDDRFQRFGLPHFAVGYKFLQGPIVPGLPTDSAVRNFQHIPGEKNLPMTTCIIKGTGSDFSDPPRGSSAYNGGTGGMWQWIRGFAPTAIVVGDVDRRYPAPPGYDPRFLFPDDPETEQTTGWLDGRLGPYTGVDSNGLRFTIPPGDRRFHISSGPFSLAPGDTQDIIVATFAAFGKDRFNSVTSLKHRASAIQEAFDSFFHWPNPPAPPNVRYAELDGKVILEWGSDLASANKTELEIRTPGDYAFEGYNIYQYPGPSLSFGKRIATYDLNNGILTVFGRTFVPEFGAESDIPLQMGTDTGIRRFFQFDRDYLGGVEKLNNGVAYYLGVTAYSVTPHPSGFQKTIESVPTVLTVRPLRPFGTMVRTAFGDTVSQVLRTAGTSSTSLIPIVINPLKVINASYTVVADTNTLSYQTTQIADSIIVSRSSASVRLAVSDNEAAPIYEGIQWKLVNAPPEAADEFVVNTGFEAMVQNAAAAELSIDRVNVFPNPYFGFNPLETNRFQPFVTFTNLPRRVRIRIFNLAGHLITLLDKDNDSQVVQWNLTNFFNVRQASGLYVAHLEFPDLGITKILKLSIILEQVYPIR